MNYIFTLFRIAICLAYTLLVHHEISFARHAVLNPRKTDLMTPPSNAVVPLGQHSPSILTRLQQTNNKPKPIEFPAKPAIVEITTLDDDIEFHLADLRGFTGVLDQMKEYQKSQTSMSEHFISAYKIIDIWIARLIYLTTLTDESVKLREFNAIQEDFLVAKRNLLLMIFELCKTYYESFLVFNETSYQIVYQRERAKLEKLPLIHVNHKVSESKQKTIASKNSHQSTQ